MKRKVQVWIDGEELRDAEPRALIQQLRDGAPEIETVFGENPWGDGQRFIARRRTGKQITISVQIRELFDLGARQQAVDNINRWARDGVMMTSAHPGKRIAVIATGWAALQAARDYTETLTLTFEAARAPYWEDEDATLAELTCTASTSGTGAITNPGSADAPVSVTVKPSASDGEVTSATLTVAGQSIAFSGIGATQSSPLVIDYDERGFFRARVGSASVLSKRSAASADELIAAPGVNAIGLTASAAASAVFSLRGRYK